MTQTDRVSAQRDDMKRAHVAVRIEIVEGIRGIVVHMGRLPIAVRRRHGEFRDTT